MPQDQIHMTERVSRTARPSLCASELEVIAFATGRTLSEEGWPLSQFGGSSRGVARYVDRVLLPNRTEHWRRADSQGASCSAVVWCRRDNSCLLCDSRISLLPHCLG